MAVSRGLNFPPRPLSKAPERRETLSQVRFLSLYPDASVLPKRRKPVYGKSLLWQPEVAFVYLAVTEKYSDCVDAVEAATGAIQNLTACTWKVGAF